MSESGGIKTGAEAMRQHCEEVVGQRGGRGSLQVIARTSEDRRSLGVEAVVEEMEQRPSLGRRSCVLSVDSEL
eukprot:3715629-Rhodomonas_salina.4